MDLTAHGSFVDLLRARAQHQPERRAFTYLADGDETEELLSYAELETRARAIGALLQSVAARGERVVLLYPPGLDFIVAFLGCLYAGAIAVPAYPPAPARLQRMLPRLEAVVKDAGAAVVLTTSPILTMAEAIFGVAPGLQAAKWLATDETIRDAPSAAAAWHNPSVTGKDVAFLQYTSGSTGAPKGVVLTHSNLLVNQKMIVNAFRGNASTVGVCWLPLYHDMGLIGHVLGPIYMGASAVLMSPLDFLQQPVRWLRAIAKYRATISGGPNFAYDLCVRKTRPEQRESLDLSSWQVAFNGAEPVRGETLERFAETFANAGFSRGAFLPCYGLAEATLLVSGSILGTGSPIHAFRSDALEHGRLAPCSPGEPGTRELVACGRPVDQDVVIVDPQTGAPCEVDRIGEIWVSGPHVAQGYWGNVERSAEVFGARLTAHGGAYLRTGDLGFRHDGFLYVAARLKDLIIVRGRNHYPQDIEQTLESSHPSLRLGCSVAFSVEAKGEERLVVVAEVDHRRNSETPFDADPVIGALRAAIAEEHGLNAYAVVLIAPRSLSKTSSGKVQRRATREAFLTGRLDEIARQEFGADEQASAASEEGAGLLELPSGERAGAIEAHLQRQLARVLGVAVSRITATTAFVTLGLDSLMAVEMAENMESAFDVRIPMAILFRDDLTIGALAEHLASSMSARSNVPVPLRTSQLAMSRIERGSPIPLSFPQLQMWNWEQKNPATGAWNSPVALRLKGKLRVDLWERVVVQLLTRHEILRARIHSAEGVPMQTFAPAAEFQLEHVDLTACPERLQQEILDRSYTAFAVADAPLTRAILFRVAPDDYGFLLLVHHLSFDATSARLVVVELRKAYEEFERGEAERAPDPLVYADFASWQQELFRQSAWGDDLKYWTQRLRGADPVRLPYDKPMPQRPTRTGIKHGVFLPGALRESLEALAHAESATMYAVIAALLAVVLRHHGAGDDVVVGIVKSTRDLSPELGTMIGYFTNQLPIRVDMKENPTVRQLVHRARDATRGAYAHQQAPASLVLDTATPLDSPHLRVVCNLVGAVATGVEAWGDLMVEPIPVPTPPLVRAGDLTLVLADLPVATVGELVGLADRFETKTIGALAAGFEEALRRAVAAPDAPIDELFGAMPR